MDLYHGQITHFQKMLLQMGKSPQNPARDSLGQIPLLGIISPYYRSAEGCRLASGLLLMNFTIQNWPREHESDFANQLELITSRKPGLGLQETHTKHTQHLGVSLISWRNKEFLAARGNDGSAFSQFPGPWKEMGVS